MNTRKKIKETGGTLTGWLCPRCGCGNSPFVLKCQENCHVVYKTTYTTTDSGFITSKKKVK